jgi:hypothetical protein
MINIHQSMSNVNLISKNQTVRKSIVRVIRDLVQVNNPKTDLSSSTSESHENQLVDIEKAMMPSGTEKNAG